jgi:capsular polysaccharide biosynthesis protein
MEEHGVDIIDYLNVLWKRKYLIIGGVVLTAAAALVVGLATPKTYKVSRTIRIGRLPGGIHEEKIIEGKLVESRETVIGRLTDHRVMKMVMEKVHSGLPNTEIGTHVSISTKANPNVKYIVQSHDPQAVVRIADGLAEYVIKLHKPLIDRRLQITKEHETHLEGRIRSLEIENREIKKSIKRVIQDQNVDPIAVVLLQANIGERERNLTDLRKGLNEARLSRLGFKNTSVIAADASPQYPVKPRVKLYVVLVGTLGLMGFTFLAFFLEYIERARSKE